jgi:hypothetical protein
VLLVAGMMSGCSDEPKSDTDEIVAKINHNTAVMNATDEVYKATIDLQKSTIKGLRSCLRVSSGQYQANGCDALLADINAHEATLDKRVAELDALKP